MRNSFYKLYLRRIGIVKSLTSLIGAEKLSFTQANSCKPLLCFCFLKISFSGNCCQNPSPIFHHYKNIIIQIGITVEQKSSTLFLKNFVFGNKLSARKFFHKSFKRPLIDHLCLVQIINTKPKRSSLMPFNICFLILQFSVNRYMLKVNYKHTKKGVKYAQS